MIPFAHVRVVSRQVYVAIRCHACRCLPTCCQASDHSSTGIAHTSSSRHASACRSSCLPLKPPSLVSWLGMHTYLTTPFRHCTTAPSHSLPATLPPADSQVFLTQEKSAVSKCKAACLLPYAASVLLMNALDSRGMRVAGSRMCRMWVQGAAWASSWVS